MTEIECKRVGDNSLIGTAIRHQMKKDDSFIIIVGRFLKGVNILKEVTEFSKWYPNAVVIQG